MARRGPKVKFSKARDATALFLALRARGLTYRRAISDVSKFFGVSERNIERELGPDTLLVLLPSRTALREMDPAAAKDAESLRSQVEAAGLCAIAANKNLVRANVRKLVRFDIAGNAMNGFTHWPEPYRAAMTAINTGQTHRT